MTMQMSSHSETTPTKAKPCCSTAPMRRAWRTSCTTPQARPPEAANRPSSLPTSGREEHQPARGGSSHGWRSGGSSQLSRTAGTDKTYHAHAIVRASHTKKEAAMANVRTESVKISVGGQEMLAHLALPEAAGPRPAVLVFQEIFGINAHIRDVANRIAAEGY